MQTKERLRIFEYAQTWSIVRLFILINTTFPAKFYADIYSVPNRIHPFQLKYQIQGAFTFGASFVQDILGDCKKLPWMKFDGLLIFILASVADNQVQFLTEKISQLSTVRQPNLV
ncbi:hypothetical protein SAMN05660293_05237 [Dyadobacter psychrophilus]|uniref:Uncharacterized protein n=1 Tax=Dyadobacter psychrophilus TaxID=651661 RepID=A0A1T5HBV4_9BACT|nr:hypothetical protein SAMN05660293_05237 [Dyadobacter psychrophilus]